MAHSSPTPDPFDELELGVNSMFDRLVVLLNQRRETLLTELCYRRDESRAKHAHLEEMIKQINDTKSHVESGLKFNPLKSMHMKMIEEMQVKVQELELSNKDLPLKFENHTEVLENIIANIGAISEDKTIYYKKLIPKVSVAKKGESPGEILGPTSVAIDDNTGNIYVVEDKNTRVSIFLNSGHYITFFGKEHLSSPSGIAIHDDSLYISDKGNNSILHFRLRDQQLLNQIGGIDHSGLFYLPIQVTVNSNGDVYVADCGHSRITVLTFDLKYMRHISHETLKYPIDLKLSRNLLHVLSSVDSPCIHVFSLTGDKIRSFLARGEGMLLVNPNSFCIDSNSNFLISDVYSHSIKVFDKEGSLVHTLEDILEKRKLFEPKGVTVTKEGRVVCISGNEKFGLHIFY